MNFLKSKPIYTFLLAAFFCLHGALENFGFISFVEAMEVFIYVIIAITILFYIFYFTTKSFLFSGFITFLLAALYLFFEVIKNAVFKIDLFNRYVLFLPLLILSLLFIIFLFKKYKWFYKVTFFLNVLLIVYCVLDAGLIIKKQMTTQKIVYQNFVVLNEKLVKHKPNVYLLLFDEYAGLQSLKDSFNYDNSIFYDQLRNDSFQIINSFSNYSITAFSMSSLFQMNYLNNLQNTTTVGWKETQQCMLDIKNAPVFIHFKNLGYDVKSFSLFEVLNNKSLGANQFLLGHQRVLTHKMFHNVFLKDVGFNFTNGRFASSFFQKLFLADLPAYSTAAERKMLNTVENKTNPQFVYTHFLMPHYPFLYDSLGNKNALQTIFKDRAWLVKEDYISYLKYCNKKMVEMERKIIEKEPGAIIILLSDHGFRYEGSHNDKSEFNNFCAVRNLSTSNLHSTATISNVNLFRYIFNATYKQSFPYLTDSMVFLKEQ